MRICTLPANSTRIWTMATGRRQIRQPSSSSALPLLLLLFLLLSATLSTAAAPPQPHLAMNTSSTLRQTSNSSSSGAAVVSSPAAVPKVGGERESVEEGFMRWVQEVGERYRRRGQEGRRKAATFVTAAEEEEKTVAHALIVVDQAVAAASSGGAARFTSIQAAVDSVPDNNVVRVKIHIAPGTYQEKVLIPRTKPFITLEGSGNTTIEWGDTANMLGADGTPIGTYKTATVGIDASYFIAKNITFKNTAPLPPIGSTNQQAVALRISGDAAVFIGCQFIGTQDTLYDHKGRHFFQDCYIAGSMDFIFGDGLSMYKNCHLHAIGAPYKEALTAQARDNPQDNTGFSFVNCKVTGTGVVYLGRAWGTFSRVVYSYTYMDSIIIPAGWNDWGDPKRHATVYYGQFKCYGPGANASGRESWSKELTVRDALPFIELSFIDGT